MTQAQADRMGGDVLHGIGIAVLFVVGSAVQIVLGGHGGGTAGMWVVYSLVGLVSGGASEGGQGVAALTACTFFTLFAAISTLIFPREFRIIPASAFAIAACITWAIPIFAFGEYWPVTAITGTPILASAALAVRRAVSTSRVAAHKRSG